MSVSVDGVVCVSTTAALTLLICVRFVLPMYLCILYSMNCVTQDRWESNAWQSQGISAEELVKVVKTVFQHTPLREECVERIRSHR